MKSGVTGFLNNTPIGDTAKVELTTPVGEITKVGLTKEAILKLDPSDYSTANKMIVTFLKSHGERGFDTIAKEGRVLLLLKNEQQVEDVIKILLPTGLNLRKDRLMKLSLTIDLQDLELNVPPIGAEGDDSLTNDSIFE